MLPCLIFEDDHLLAVDKPAGLNTHAPGPFAGEGLYDWLRHREPRWATLAIIHRLDKETSGVIVFAKTPLANRSLTAQFAQREVKKKYLLLTDRAISQRAFVVTSALVRLGDKYASQPEPAFGGQVAETSFQLCQRASGESGTPATVFNFSSHTLQISMLMAEPRTGRTHQIRVHAAEQGFPVLGDMLYGGTPAARVYLHAAELRLRHPASGKQMKFSAPFDITQDPRLQLLTALIDPALTNAWRVLHGGSDSQPGWYVDRLGDHLLSQSEQALDETQQETLENL